jgi:tetratricopeptide (TPR) repeat protein
MDLINLNEISIELDSGLEPFAALADEYCSRGLWEEAVRECRRCLAHHPQHLRARVLLGWALKELGERDEAQRILKAAAGEIQRNALLFSLIAEIAENAGDMKRAELFREIGKNLRATALETVAAPAATSGLLPETSESSPPLASILESLLERFQAKPAATADSVSLFSPEDRSALIGILKSFAR